MQKCESRLFFFLDFWRWFSGFQIQSESPHMYMHVHVCSPRFMSRVRPLGYCQISSSSFPICMVFIIGIVHYTLVSLFTILWNHSCLAKTSKKKCLKNLYKFVLTVINLHTAIILLLVKTQQSIHIKRCRMYCLGAEQWMVWIPSQFLCSKKLLSLWWSHWDLHSIIIS